MEPGFVDIKALLADALKKTIGETDVHIGVSPCQDPQFGDYQSNVALPLAKKLEKKPRTIAEEIVAKLQLSELCEKIDVAGAGFINFHLKAEFIQKQLEGMLADGNNLQIAKVSKPEVMVLDFAGPNIAKEMHVGHIRTHFLGDSMARISRFAGHQVITDNHLGDWGTQFGMIIYGYKNFLNREAFEKTPIGEAERLYKKVTALCEENPEIKNQARFELAKLQSGDVENVKIWEDISKHSLTELHKVYERIKVHFDYELGESFYNPMLKEVVAELVELGIAQESEGAICIFFPDDPSLKDAAPMMIQKSDKAALYATTDLATVLYRVENWKSDRILYFTDARQQLHFKQLFKASEKWLPKKNYKVPSFHHIVFGSVLGPDKKPFKTRSGEPLKFNDLLNEAEERAAKIIEERNPDLAKKEKAEIARVVGIGALKYADLCQNRNLDYIFDWNKLLAFQGNTAPYLIYAYVRIRSIFRALPEGVDPGKSGYVLSTPEEIALTKHLIQFSDAIHSVLEDYRPHLVCNYLYELASRFSKFYEACPILKADEPIRSSRLALADLTAQVLKKGLNLLGIETLEKM